MVLTLPTRRHLILTLLTIPYSTIQYNTMFLTTTCTAIRTYYDYKYPLQLRKRYLQKEKYHNYDRLFICTKLFVCASGCGANVPNVKNRQNVQGIKGLLE